MPLSSRSPDAATSGTQPAALHVRAVAFDFGDTLIEYEGLPLSWEAHYPAALAALAAHCRISVSEHQVQQACDVLRRYNTRLHPRDTEVAFAAILERILRCFGSTVAHDPYPCAFAFFSVFRQRLRLFPDALPTLHALRQAGYKIGIFTDVPYGMPRELVLEDVAGAGLGGAYDVLLTSGDCGFRKPHVAALQALASALGVEPTELAYVGNEEKDVRVALAFGCRAILLARTAPPPEWGQAATVTSLCHLL